MLFAGNHTSHNHIVSTMNLVDVFIIHSATSATVDHCGSKIQASKITCHPRALSLHPYSHCPLYTMLIVNIVMHTICYAQVTKVYI